MAHARATIRAEITSRIGALGVTVYETAEQALAGDETQAAFLSFQSEPIGELAGSNTADAEDRQQRRDVSLSIGLVDVSQSALDTLSQLVEEAMAATGAPWLNLELNATQFEPLDVEGQTSATAELEYTLQYWTATKAVSTITN